MQQTIKMLAPLAVAAAFVGVRRRRAKKQLAGKSALVTGGSRGLGLLMAEELARCGCRVVICARDHEELRRAQEKLAGEGVHIGIHPCDLTDIDQIKAMVETLTAELSGIDILVNNAGVMQVGPIETMGPADFERAMNVMFWGLFHTTWEVLPQMYERGDGRIVNITSIGGMVSVPHLLPYSAAKFAAVGFSQGLRTELKRRGISVVTIVPGLMRTASYRHVLFHGQQEGEYSWFTLGSTLPLITLNARRAARQIIMATAQRKPVHIVGLPANILARVAGLFPGLVVRLSTVAGAAFMPSPEVSGGVPTPGAEVRQSLSKAARKFVDAASTLGRRQETAYNQAAQAFDELPH